jgi:hypothetical protein
MHSPWFRTGPLQWDGLENGFDVPLVNFPAVDPDRFRRGDPEPNSVPLDGDHGEANITIDHDFFADSS